MYSGPCAAEKPHSLYLIHYMNLFHTEPLLLILQWDFFRVERSCCSARDIERRSRASANPTKTSPTKAIILPLLQPTVVKSLVVSHDVSSSASLSGHPANQKAKLQIQMEEQAHWITDHCWGMIINIGQIPGVWQVKQPSGVVCASIVRYCTFRREILNHNTDF